MADYIPRKDAVFDQWFSFICQYVSQKCAGQSPQWTHIPQTERDRLEGQYTAWKTAYGATTGPHTKVATVAKNEARKAAEEEIRPFVNRFLRYEPVTNEDRTAMGIPNHSEGRSPVPVPLTSPRLLIGTGTRRRLIVHFRDERSERRGKPKGVHGIEVRWAILDHPPADIRELIHSSFDTRSPLTLEFEEHQRGQRAYMCGSWEIKREGEKGPPGDIEEAVIP
jgi:hypothetical protein